MGLYSDLSAAEIKYIALNCEAEFAMVEDQEQVDKIEQIINQLPKLRKVIYWRYKGLIQSEKRGCLSGTGMCSNWAVNMKKATPEYLNNNIAGARRKISALLFTPPAPPVKSRRARCILIDHYKWASEYYLKLDKINQKDNLVSYLPPAWITEQWLAFGCHLLSGSTVNFAESAETSKRISGKLVRHWCCIVPVYGKGKPARCRPGYRGSGALKKLAFRWFMPVGYKMAELKYKKQKPGWSAKDHDCPGLLAVVPARARQPGFAACQDLL